MRWPGVAWLLLAVLLPGALFASPVARAQGVASLQMSARAGYGDDGSYLIGAGAWFPVRVTLVNPAGAPSLHVRVEVDSSGTGSGPESTYARELDLPSPARKEVVLYAYSAQYSHSVNVRLMQGSTVLGTVRPQLNPLDPTTDMILGLVSSDASSLNLLRGEKAGHRGTAFLLSNYGQPPGAGPLQQSSRINVATVALSDIPPLATALGPFGALVVDDVDTGTITREQHDALSQWVQQGGTLVVASRPGGADAAAGLADLLPVKVGGTRNLSAISSLADLVSSPITITSGTLTSVSTPLSGAPVYARVLALQDGVPLAAVRDLGQGQVVYLALSPSAPPLRGWDGLVPLFKRLLAEHKVGVPFPAEIVNGGYNGSYYGANSGIFDVYGNVLDLPGLDLPSGWLMAGFLFLYILVIGPLNFIVLRKMRRAELAWATIPGLVLLFSLGAYVIAYGAKGGDLVMPRADITYSFTGAGGSTGLQMWGLFSPLRRTYNLSVGADSLVSQFEQYSYGGGAAAAPRVVGGDTTTLQNVVIDTGGLKAFVAQNSLDTGSPLEADLHLGDGVIVGTLKNRTSRGLQDVSLVRGDAVQNLGYIAAGASVPVKLLVRAAPLNNNSPASLLPAPAGVSAPTNGGYYSSSSSPEQRAYTRRLILLGMALQPVVTNDPPTRMDVLATAWGGDTPVGVSVEGHSARTEEISLWVSRLPVVSSAEDKPTLQNGVPYWTYQAGSADTPWVAGPPKESLTPYADVHFMLPPGTSPRSLSLVYDTGQQTAHGVDLLAYNTKTGAWDRLGELAQVGAASQSTRTVDLSDPGNYTGAGGDVTVRFKAQSGNTSVQFTKLDLVLNGKQ